tara:strand:+ start:542 stop:1177 length:636 start_codon:yes stop_codon:yes gene_type:complete
MKKKISIREKIFFSPWAVLSVLFAGILFMNVTAFADHEDDNYERQKANIDMANDGIVGYTHDGLPVYQSEVDEAELDKEGYIVKGLRQLDINIKGIQKVDALVLNVNTVELHVPDGEDRFKIYTILVDCKLTEIDNFQWQTRGDGALNVGDFAIVRANPFKYFENPELELTKKQIEAKLKNWDINQRVCVINSIQMAGIVEPPIPLEGVRG